MKIILHIILILLVVYLLCKSTQENMADNRESTVDNSITENVVMINPDAPPDGPDVLDR